MFPRELNLWQDELLSSEPGEMWATKESDHFTVIETLRLPCASG